MSQHHLVPSEDNEIYVDLVRKEKNSKKTFMNIFTCEDYPILLVFCFIFLAIASLITWFFLFDDENHEVLSRNQRGLKSPCPDDYFFFPQTGFCYKHYHTPALFMKAEEKCQSEGGHIASIHSEQEHLMLIGLHLTAMKRVRKSYQQWIGLHTVDGKWSWSDGSKVDYLVWSSGNSVAATKTSFAYRSAFTFEWYKTDSYQKVFTCKRPSSVKVIPKDYLKYTPCAIGYTWFEHTGQCYKVVSTSTSFENATKLCEAEEATIAPVHSEIENMFLMGLGIKHRNTSSDIGETSYGQDIWIGLNDDMKTWQDETLVDYRNWGHGQPADNKKHVKIAIKSGKWVTESSNDMAICKKY